MALRASIALISSKTIPFESLFIILGDTISIEVHHAQPELCPDIALVSGVMEHARVEWGWLSINPINDLSKPSKPDHRDRVISGPEIRAR